MRYEVDVAVNADGNRTCSRSQRELDRQQSHPIGGRGAWLPFVPNLQDRHTLGRLEIRMGS